MFRTDVDGIDGLQAVIVSRPWKHGRPDQDSLRLLTATLVNRKCRSGGSDDENSIFQAGIRVSGRSQRCWIVPYPESGQERSGPLQDTLSDESINRILYREQRTYAIGHGCAADWSDPDDGTVSRIWSDVLPVHETPATTAELEFSDSDGNRNKLRVSMRKLAGLDTADSGWDEVGLLISEYENWIRKLREDELPIVEEAWRDTGEALIQRCEQCLGRIRDGIALLESEGDTGNTARRAFALANHAMLIAQVAGRRAGKGSGIFRIRSHMGPSRGIARSRTAPTPTRDTGVPFRSPFCSCH